MKIQKIEVTPFALKAIKQLSPAVQAQMIQFLEEIYTGARNPRDDIEGLAEEYDNFRRYRVAGYRILWKIEGDVLTLFSLAPECFQENIP